MGKKKARSNSRRALDTRDFREDAIVIDPKEREYYIITHGFDPVADAKPLYTTSVGYQYEARFPLSNDPILANAGVIIIARVKVENNGSVHNRIVFSREGVEADFQCAHTVVYGDLPIDDLTSVLDTPIEDAQLRDGTPVTLPPWGHFAALKSFVAGIADVGIQNLIQRYVAPYNEKFTDPAFGFNTAFISRSLYALQEVAPQATVALLRDYLMEILETASMDWLKARRDFMVWLLNPSTFASVWKSAPEDWIVNHFGKMRVLLEIPYFWDMLVRISGGHLLVLKTADEEINKQTEELGIPEILEGLGIPEHEFDEEPEKNPRIIPTIWRDLARDPDVEVRKRAALHPALPTDIRDVLLEDADLSVRVETVNNPSNPPDLLTSVYEQPGPLPEILRRVLARHAHAPASLLQQLAKDTSIDVRYDVAQNPNSPIEILKNCTDSVNWIIHLGVARNPVATSPILQELAERHAFSCPNGLLYCLIASHVNSSPATLQLIKDHTNNQWVLKHVAQNPRAPPELLTNLAFHSYQYLPVKAGVAGNPNTPVLTLKILERTDANQSSQDELSQNVAKNLQTRDPAEIARLPLLSYPMTFDEIGSALAIRSEQKANLLKKELENLEHTKKIEVFYRNDQYYYFNRTGDPAIVNIMDSFLSSPRTHNMIPR